MKVTLKSMHGTGENAVEAVDAIYTVKKGDPVAHVERVHPMCPTEESLLTPLFHPKENRMVGPEEGYTFLSVLRMTMGGVLEYDDWEDKEDAVETAPATLSGQSQPPDMSALRRFYETTHYIEDGDDEMGGTAGDE